MWRLEWLFWSTLFWGTYVFVANCAYLPRSYWRTAGNCHSLLEVRDPGQRQACRCPGSVTWFTPGRCGRLASLVARTFYGLSLASAVGARQPGRGGFRSVSRRGGRYHIAYTLAG